jgi:hypothetical protein
MILLIIGLGLLIFLICIGVEGIYQERELKKKTGFYKGEH